MHLKRQQAPKNWPIFRKGTKYVVRPKFDTQKGIPLLIVLRDLTHSGARKIPTHRWDR